MNPNLKWKLILILAVVLASIYGLIGMPTFPTSWAQVKQNLSNRIRLGLDLRGGTQLILQVKVEEAVSLTTDGDVNRLADRLRERGIAYDSIDKLDDTHFIVRNIGEGATTAFRSLITQEYAPRWELSTAAGEPNSFTLSMSAAEAARIRAETLSQAVETIRRRVDALGLTEPVIAEHGRGENEILIQLPGVGDPARVKEVIRVGGLLEFRLVRGEREFASEADCFAQYQGVLPRGTECVPGQPDQPQAQAGEVWYLLDRVPGLTGRDLRSAQAGPSQDGIPGRFDVNFNVSAQYAPSFERFTQQNVQKRMAIVLDGRVTSAPVIQSAISDRGSIEGNFSQQEARDLALVLRSGSLPASIRYLEERIIGPSLGADSIRQGFTAAVVSLLLVMGFMLLYYRKAGINANIGLTLNLLILLALLAYLGAALTLPGIAGVILTVGMGVDSNVLIFERIREELRAGKANASAVEAGFDRAFLTIIDTHVTTIVSCFFLFMFGTGPVQGFAVSLVLGLAANVFTAVYVSRAIFHWYLSRMERGAALSI
ncbi:MAG: protein translocase subunit SecD [Candidatus Acidiferrales bacterium]